MAQHIRRARVVTEYMRKSNITTVYEGLLTALAVEVPEDPLAFIIERLEDYLENQETTVLCWEAFLDPDTIPPVPHRPYWLAPVDDDDEANQPTGEMCVKAFKFNSIRAYTIYYGAWKRFVADRKHARMILEAKFEAARQVHRTTLKKKYLKVIILQDSRRVILFKHETTKNSQSLLKSFIKWLEYTRGAQRAARWLKAMQEQKNPRKVVAAGMEPPQDSFSNLALPVQLNVFRFLDVGDLARCALTCRTWQEVAVTASLHHNLRFSPFRQAVTNDVLFSLTHRYRPFIEKINLRGCAHLTGDILPVIAQCANLSTLVLADCPLLRSKGFQELLSGCTSLNDLDISDCPVIDVVFRYIATYCEHLLTLTMRNCTQITDIAAEWFQSGSFTLRITKIDMSGCSSLGPRGIAGLLSVLPQLTCVNLSGTAVTDSAIIGLIDSGAPLEEIRLRDCVEVTDIGLEYVRTRQNLRIFEVANNSRITTRSVRSLCQLCLKLDTIIIDNCPGIEAHIFAACKLPALKTLSITNCCLADETLRYIADAPGPRIYLKSVDLSGCANVGDSGVFAVATKCPNITHVSLVGCNLLSDIAFERLFFLKNIKHLDLRGCLGLTDRSLLIDHLSHVTHVNLSGCYEISDRGLEGLAILAPRMLELDLSYCVKLTDAGIRQLMFGCRYLRSLNLQSCSGLTLASLTALQTAGLMRNLNIFGINGLHIPALKDLLRACTDLYDLTLATSDGLVDDVPHILGGVRPGIRCYFNSIPPPATPVDVLLSSSVDMRAPSFNRRQSSLPSLSRGSSTVHLLSGAKRFTRGSVVTIARPTD